LLTARAGDLFKQNGEACVVIRPVAESRRELDEQRHASGQAPAGRFSFLDRERRRCAEAVSGHPDTGAARGDAPLPERAQPRRERPPALAHAQGRREASARDFARELTGYALPEVDGLGQRELRVFELTQRRHWDFPGGRLLAGVEAALADATASSGLRRRHREA
jgi:hypothetical protein